MVDKFGHYKPVLFVSLLFNAIFHHSLMLIPQMETPGKIPPAYVMRHPQHGKVEVSIYFFTRLCIAEEDRMLDDDFYWFVGGGKFFSKQHVCFSKKIV